MEANKPNGTGHEEGDNIITFDPKRRSSDPKPPKPPREPILNLPPTTQTLMGVLTIWYLILEAIGFYDINLRYQIYGYLGFVPGAFTGATPFEFYHLFGFVMYVFIHGSWMHFLMNVIMLAAFGSGLERFEGGRRMIEVFIISSFAGLVMHFLIYSGSLSPVIGASGGLSGIFGAVIVVLNRRGMLGNNRYGVWPFVALWVGISVIFGIMGSSMAGGASIAWVAHLGGFFAGLLMARKMVN